MFGAARNRCDSLHCETTNQCISFFCNRTTEDCQVGPKVICPQPEDKCTFSACDKKNGKCNIYKQTCSDSSICTENLCDSSIGCYFPANNTKCATDKCSTGVCTSTGCEPKVCPLSTKCKVSQGCDKKTGECTFKPFVCNDNIDCTTDKCDEEKGCIYTPDHSKCNDSNECTIGDQCVVGKGCVYKEKNCTSSDLCQISSGCNKKTGQCIFSPVQCKSVNKCETIACNPSTGKCELTPIICRPSNKCEISVCNLSTGKCESTPITCSSSNKCETTACDLATGKCRVTNVKACPPIKTLGIGALCQARICDPPTGNCINDPHSTRLNNLFC
ncbi:hypothetical protein CYY_001670 [Polysphondylium violaceum]|uniref:Extracellular matrix protein n=1 Tax=Polysphondylium violaceum TaxID=133409 RepID=A0A8J4V3X2_9MYCE|nr:hypothetical protein CYY_001670 [Polysphondylium violaceum]